MMNVVAIGAVTVREALRRKIQVNLLLFALLLVVASLLVSSLTIGDTHRIASDLGLTAMEVMGSLTAIFLGASLVAGDVDRRVLYPVVAKPVSRSEYLLGRYVGLAGTLWLNLAVMALTLSALLVLDAGSLRPIDGALLAAFAMLGVQFLVVAAVALLFSSVTTPTLAAIFALAITIAGHLSNDLRTLWHGPGARLGKAIWYLLPNLSALSLNEQVIYRTPPAVASWVACLYAALYAGAALAIAATVFERRDFR
ncbi:ABC transporter permease [Anaeromyxobacter terrae]|uniref:ABC transporter permease n=1 Tax=Anaeromyxobacter terrae TaxID=2925406 RepID=UPI001F5933A2|nr:ABC transporter permease subunit [Anaeromyxobacter sp. SG22]